MQAIKERNRIQPAAACVFEIICEFPIADSLSKHTEDEMILLTANVCRDACHCIYMHNVYVILTTVS